MVLLSKTADNLVLYDDPAIQGTFDGYNDRGELQHARRHAGDDPDVPGLPLTPNHYAYDYDDSAAGRLPYMVMGCDFVLEQNNWSNRLSELKGKVAAGAACVASALKNCP